MKKIIIIGASGHGKVAADIAKLNGYKEIAFLDDDPNKKNVGQYTVIGTCKDIYKYKNLYAFFVAIGDNSIREKISLELNSIGIKQTTLIHPSAVIAETVQLGEGVIIMPNVVINADARIAKGAIINTSATVDHDCNIGDYTHISPGVHMAGNVNIGSKVWVGIGTIMINNISICSDCLIGAGATVIRDIKAPGKFVGTPIRRIE